MKENSVELLKLRRLVEDGKNVMLFGPEDTESQQTVISYIRAIQSLPNNIVTIEVSSRWSALDFAYALDWEIRKILQPGSRQQKVDLSYRDIMEDALTWADEQRKGCQSPLVLIFRDFHLLSVMPDGKVDAAFRTIIQRINNLSLVFMSSNKEALSRMFILKSEPLYGMASTINLS